jgi:hypothetical protein
MRHGAAHAHIAQRPGGGVQHQVDRVVRRAVEHRDALDAAQALDHFGRLQRVEDVELAVLERDGRRRLVAHDAEDDLGQGGGAAEIVGVGGQRTSLPVVQRSNTKGPGADRVHAVALAELRHRAAGDEPALVEGAELVQEAGIRRLQHEAHGQRIGRLDLAQARRAGRDRGCPSRDRARARRRTSRRPR